MKKLELWAIYCSRNPSFADDSARFTITGRGLRKMFEQAYDKGHEQGVANGKALAEMQRPERSLSEKLFGDFFKK